MPAPRYAKYAWARSMVRVRKQSPIPNVKNLTHFRTRCHLLLPLRMRTLTSPSMRFSASRAVVILWRVIGSHHISRKHRDPWERRRGREWRKWQKNGRMLWTSPCEEVNKITRVFEMKQTHHLCLESLKAAHDDSNLFVGVSNQGVINYNPDSRCGKREITNNQSQMTNFTTWCPKQSKY